MNLIQSYDELVKRMVEIYSFFPYQKRVDFLKRMTYKNFLASIRDRNEDIVEFFRSVLDVIGILSVTGVNLLDSELGDVTRLGKLSDVKGIFSSSEDQIDDWMCSSLFQGWATINKSVLEISRDMKYEVKNRSKVCDFLTEAKGGSALIECKRIHPFTRFESIEEVMTKVQSKVAEKTDEARVQFTNTIRLLRLGEDQYYRLVIMDISAYGDIETLNKSEMSVIGFTKPVVDSLASDSKKEPPRGVEGVCFCWSNLFYFKDLPRALAYYTKIIDLSDKNSPVDYKGWTVEYYPGSRNTEEYKELRISSIGRSHNWIHTSYQSLIDNLLRFDI